MVQTNESPMLYELNLQDLIVKVRGITSLVCNRFSEEKQGYIESKQQKKATKGKEARNPEAEFKNALYKTPDGRYGFPAIAFKLAMVGACRFLDTKMTQARGAFHVLGDVLPIEGSEPRMRADRVVLSRGTTSIAYRPEFPEPWTVTLHIRYNASFISAEQLINWLETAGFAIGVGDWRPEKDGNHGMFEVARE